MILGKLNILVEFKLRTTIILINQKRQIVQ